MDNLSMGTLNKSLADMQRGSKKAKTPEDDCHDDPNVDKKSEKSDDDDDHRDKGKAIKFRQMQKDLPPHIVDLYEKEALNKSSPRAFRTQLSSSTNCSQSCRMVDTSSTMTSLCFVMPNPCMRKV